MTTSPWQATLLTLYPDMLPGPLGQALAGRALEKGVWSLRTVDIRHYASDKHRSVDDTPFGGGAGMVMRPDIVDAALTSVANAPGPIVALTPRGRVFDQAMAAELSAGPGVTLVCGRFEGIDQRVIERRGMVEVSLGDFVLSGGELAALAILDACVRLLPGVMGGATSHIEESFEDGLLEYPHYTRPADWDGYTVPDVLLSGHHENIRQWRRQQSERITKQRRPDLWQAYQQRMAGNRTTDRPA